MAKSKQVPNATPLAARNDHQRTLLKALRTQDQVFAVGPAGTGKTYLATRVALERIHQRRLVLIRPALGADEDLGFLPGDLQEKMLPWVRPFFDIATEQLGAAEVKKCLNNSDIEIAPIAYMRGRTFSNASILVDEAQNATVEQLRMVLTRVGENASVFVTGDTQQSDIGKRSGLPAVLSMAEKMNLSVVRFGEREVVRSAICQQWTEAFLSPTELPAGGPTSAGAAAIVA